MRAILVTMDGYLLVLNSHRQLLATNQQVLKNGGQRTALGAIGSRPGEMLRCIHAQEGPGGCGISRACPGCGAVTTVLASQRTGMSADASG